MQTAIREDPHSPTRDEPWLVTHPMTPEDGAAAAAMRAASAPMRGRLQGTAARQPFDEIMGHVAPADGVTYEPDTVGGLPGWWCRPADARPGEVILYLHGGAYVWGSAQAYRPFVGHIAARAGAAAFIPDYRLAPEHPFPAAVRDVEACYRGLLAQGERRIAVVGDSAGGGLGLVLLALLTCAAARASAHAIADGVAPVPVTPVGAVALSPWTDLALTGPSWETRDAAELYFTRPQMTTLAGAYLGHHDPADPLASPLYTPAGDLAGLPPVRVHVGEDEVLLDDARRYVARAAAAGVDARVAVWKGMPHVFPSNVGTLGAAARALDVAGAFLAERLAARRP